MKVFQNLCIASILKGHVFTACHGMLLAEKHTQRFRSSIKQGPEASELEVSIPMVCVAAMVVIRSTSPQRNVLTDHVDPCCSVLGWATLPVLEREAVDLSRDV